MLDNDPAVLQGQIGGVLDRAVAAGRRPTDIIPFVNRQFIVGSTEEEAHARMLSSLSTCMTRCFLHS